MNTVQPAIAGTPAQDSALTVSDGTWAGTGPVALGYQWDRCSAAGWSCMPIAGASAATYTVTADDVGSALRAFVTGTNGSAPRRPSRSQRPCPPSAAARRP